MKKMKKLFAVLLAFAMVMGMSLTTFAADEKPVASNTALATISGVEKGATITIYQIVDAFYNENGFVEYVRDNNLTVADLADIYNPTYEEIMAIAKKTLTPYTVLEDSEETVNVVWTYGEATKNYTTNLEAGSYLVKVTGVGDVVYNPMVISIGYDKDKSGSMNTLQQGSVTAADDWKLKDAVVAAKSSDITLNKSVEDHEYEVGETVDFTVTTTIPSYSKEYTTVKFVVTDTIINGLAYSSEPVVKVGGKTLTSGYTATTAVGNGSFTITFDPDYIKGLAGKTDDDRAVVITYSAVVTEDAINAAGHNKVTLDFTNEPNKDGQKEDHEYVYTFKVDNVLTKTHKVDGVEEALEGATFTLYTKADTEDVYADETKETLKEGYMLLDVNGTKVVVESEVRTYTTLEDGDIYFAGLDADRTYYLKETAAPAGYSINETAYKVTFTVSNENKETYEYTVSILDSENKAASSVLNIKLNSLPSTGGIGTAVFTIGGCAIMIAAAYFFFVSRKKEA